MRVMISCGEPSGDLYAGALARELRDLEPGVQISGFGGDRLREAGATLVGEFGGLSVTGLTEALRVVPRAWRMYRRLVAAAAADRPDVFVAVDFPDFNFMLARAMKRLGVPVIYYIGPQLWAWRPRRMNTMRRIAARVLVIFPFEASIYERAQVPVTFVGHPLIELTHATDREGFLRAHALEPGRPVIGLLPGSRRNELRAILPALASAAGLIARRVPDAQFVIPRAPHLPEDLFAPLDAWPAAARRPVVVEHATDDVLASADVAIVASGTVTVQAALHACPMVVVYRVAPLTYRVGKPFVRVETYAMANLVAGRRIVPELIQDAFTPEAAADAALRVLLDPAHAAEVRTNLLEVRRRLGEPGASRRAAEAVLAAARQDQPA